MWRDNVFGGDRFGEVKVLLMRLIAIFSVTWSEGSFGRQGLIKTTQRLGSSYAVN